MRMLLQILNSAVGIFFILHNFFIKAFEPSSLEANLLGPKTFIFFFERKSTRPLTNGSSGPTITRSIFFNFILVILNGSSIFE